jgi:hypothetical protein
MAHGIIVNAVRRPTANVAHTEKAYFPVVQEGGGGGETRSGYDQRRRGEPSQGAETLKIANDAKSGDVLEVAGEVLHAPPPCHRFEETL